MSISIHVPTAHCKQKLNISKASRFDAKITRENAQKRRKMSYGNSANHCAKLTENELLYLYIVEEVWAMSTLWDEAGISDIKDTGGTFDTARGNTLVLDYEEHAPFDPEHVQHVIDWKEYVESEEDLRTTDLVDKLLFPGAMYSDFENVVVHVTGETGSCEEIWQPRRDDEVAVSDILEAGGGYELARQRFQD